MILNVTPSITLRELEQHDAKIIFQTIDQQRHYLGKWLPFVAHTQSQADTENFIKAAMNLPQKELIFTIWYEEEFAGLIGFKATDRLNSRTELGYWLSEPFQKKGIISCCVKFLCNYAFDRLGIHRVQIKCAVGNEPSRRIPQNMGFTFEGVEREGERVNEHLYFDLEVYSLLRTDTI